MMRTCEQSLGPATGTGPISLGQAAEFLRELADWPYRGEYVKEAIARAAKRVVISLGSRREPMPYWRAFDIWYRKAKLFRDFEGEAILEAVRLKREQDAAHELQDLRARLEILESRLRSGDADFHSPSIAALGQTLRGRR